MIYDQVTEVICCYAIWSYYYIQLFAYCLWFIFNI